MDWKTQLSTGEKPTRGYPRQSATSGLVGAASSGAKRGRGSRGSGLQVPVSGVDGSRKHGRHPPADTTGDNPRSIPMSVERPERPADRRRATRGPLRREQASQRTADTARPLPVFFARSGHTPADSMRYIETPTHLSMPAVTATFRHSIQHTHTEAPASKLSRGYLRPRRCPCRRRL